MKWLLSGRGVGTFAVSRKTVTYAWLGLISVGLVFLLWEKASSDPKVADFDQVNVHRLNVIEPDGKPRVIISNRAEMPGIYWDGKLYGHATRDQGGMLFFNDDGTEVGGMLFRNRRNGDHYSAGSGLLFDQYHQDETLDLTYDEADGKRQAGLQVWDRPDESILPAIELSDRLKNAKTDAEKAELMEERKALVKRYGAHPGRVFVGKSLGDSIVRLADAHGRPRLVLRVTASGEPVVQFLDETGKVVKEISDKLAP
jgi:hypothetical protein